MLITHRIRTINHLNYIPDGRRFILGVTGRAATSQRLQSIGFAASPSPGDSVLPSARLGKACRVNAEGWIERHRDQPMETAYRSIMWHWKVKRGDFLEDQSRVVDVPYRRYPRTEHRPYGMEISAVPTSEGGMVFAVPVMVRGQTRDFQILTAVNLLVEIFGECQVFSENLQSLIEAPIRRLNWQVLPAGEMPWDRLSTHLRSIVASKGARIREIFNYRIELINSFSPAFCAIGKNGFNGYVIFGFPNRDFFLLESIYFGNATYVLGNNWQDVSQLTKAEILHQRLHRSRIVHSVGWENEIQNLFRTRRA